MNKLLKIFLSILGAVEIVFSIFIPFALSLTIITVIGFQGFYSMVLLIAGILSSLYRALRVGII